jgi:hypothetical protein
MGMGEYYEDDDYGKGKVSRVGKSIVRLFRSLTNVNLLCF